MAATPISTEQQESLLVVTASTRQLAMQSRWHRLSATMCTRKVWMAVLVLLMIGGAGFVHMPRHKSNKDTDAHQSKSFGWNPNRNHPMNSHTFHRYSQRQPHLNSDPAEENERKSRPERPESMGHMNVYIHKPVDNDRRHPPERFRFPVARYNKRQLPFSGPFVTFMPSIPIVADRFTRQTMIYASTGVYILPPVVNSYGKLYSVAELIAYGYASLVSTGAQPSDYIDMRSLFRPMPVMGVGVPTISRATGGFVGSIRTNFGSFDMSDDRERADDSKSEEEDDDNDREENMDNYRSSSLDHHGHRRPRPSDARSPTTRKTTSMSTSTNEPVEPKNPGEVHYTLIIDTILPYATSRKSVVAVNYSSPGPLIAADEGDTFVIRVINRLAVPSTLHWHGIRQMGTPDMDGAVGVTQCAIPPRHETVYRFKAEPAGTFWYHGHLLEQYTDGLYGPLIVHRRNEIRERAYDSEHVLVVSDWYNNRAHDELLPWYLNTNNPDGVEPTPDATLVNDKFTQSLFLSLTGSTRVRFRIINAAAFSMYTVSVDGLPLHIIEVDSTATATHTVGSFDINVGQRVSFYIDLTELDPVYSSTGQLATTSLYLRIEAMLSMYPVDIVNYIPPYERQRYPYPTFFSPLYLAILSLDSNNSMPTYPASDDTPKVSTTAIPTIDTNLLDARPRERNNAGIPNATHSLYLLIVFDLGSDGINHPSINNVSYSSDANYMRMRPNRKEGITSDLYAPLLHQMAKKPDDLLLPSPRAADSDKLPTIESDGDGHYSVPYNAVVDIFLNNTDGGEHPFHLHGYTFWILATSDYPEAETLYAGDYIQRDTVSVPAFGWAKIRFRADNPGAWFFHCHIEWHMSAGLAMTLIVSPEKLLANGYEVTRAQTKLCQALREFNAKNETKLDKY